MVKVGKMKEDDPLPCTGCRFKGYCGKAHAACALFRNWQCWGRTDKTLSDVPTIKMGKRVFLMGGRHYASDIG